MQVHAARAALRALRRFPSLRSAWPVRPFQELLLAAGADMRWCGVQCLATLTGLVRSCCVCCTLCVEACKITASAGSFTALSQHALSSTALWQCPWEGSVILFPGHYQCEAQP